MRRERSFDQFRQGILVLCVQPLLYALGQQQNIPQPSVQRAGAILQKRQHPFPQGQKPRQPFVPRLCGRIVRSLRKQQRGLAAQQKPVRLRAGGGQRDLPERAVIFHEPGVLPAGDRGGRLVQGEVHLTEIFLIQKGAAPAAKRKAPVLSVKLHRGAEPLPQRAGESAVPPGGVLVQNNLPLHAAAMRARPRQTGKIVKIIRDTQLHGTSSCI